MQKSPAIVMVGSSMVDLITRVPRLPTDGETLVGSDFKIGFGGKGSNQAVMAARLGARVSVNVKLGRDVFGDQTFQNYKDQNIDTTFVTFSDDLPSGVAPITVNENTGQNSIIIVPGANSALSGEDVRSAERVIAQADVVIGQLEVPIMTTLAAFEIARSHGVLTLLNPAPAAPLPDKLWRLTDLLVPNEVEAASLTSLPVTNPAEAETAARTLQTRGPKRVVITLGEQGALVLDEQATHVGAERVKVVDATGAGDAFVGSLAFYLGNVYALLEATERAASVATLSVQKRGTQTSFPYAEEVRKYLESRDKRRSEGS